MVVIRLTRVGKKNSPAYRIVIADKRRAVKGKFIEIIGHYNPMVKPKEVVISKERALFWIDQGAQPSDTVRNLMVDQGILGKDQKAAKVYGKEMGKKAAKEAAANPKAEPSAEKPNEEPNNDDSAEISETVVEEEKAEETAEEEPAAEEDTTAE